MPVGLVCVELFREMAARSVQHGVPEMALMRQNVEAAVADLFALVETKFTAADKLATADVKLQLLEHYQSLCSKAMMGSIIESLGLLRSKFAPPSGGLIGALCGDGPEPIFAVGMELVAPEVNMNPSLAEVQVVINQVAKGIVMAAKGVPGWGALSASGPTG